MRKTDAIEKGLKNLFICHIIGMSGLSSGANQLSATILVATRCDSFGSEEPDI